jgi:cation:H+ antiporter
MQFLDFTSNSIILNLVIFVVAAVIIWFTGTRLSIYGDIISDRTNLGKAFMGLLFLALATEMPEIGTTVSAALANEPQLAVNSIFGGVLMQTFVLVIVDIALIKGALTFFTPKPTLILQGVLLIILLGLALAAVSVGEFIVVANIGLWSFVLFITYIAALFLSQRYEGNETWDAENKPSEEESETVVVAPENTDQEKRFDQWSTRRLALTFIGFSLVILVIGFTLSRVAEALAEQTGLGASFVGATLLATATSLPELSVAISAVRLRRYDMAFASIFGSNSIMMLLVFVADIFYREGAILNQVDTSVIFSAAMGIVLTAVYLTGLIERRNRTVLRMGLDSAVVLVLYVVSLVILYQLR